MSVAENSAKSALQPAVMTTTEVSTVSKVEPLAATAPVNATTAPNALPTTCDTSVKVIEKVQNRVVTNKTVVQRTTNTNATQVNRYDADGNLKSSDVDSTSWEERDSRSYEWTHREKPPAEALEPPATDRRFEEFFANTDQQQQQQVPLPYIATEKELPVITNVQQTAVAPTSGGGQGDQPAVVLTERRDIPPAIAWSGSTSSDLVDDSDGSEQRTTTKMEGSQWSRSGEAVWISSAAKPAELQRQPPPAAVKSAADAVVNGPPSGTAAAAAGSEDSLSVEERRRRRCAANRSRKSATAAQTVTTSSSSRTRPSPTSP